MDDNGKFLSMSIEELEVLIGESLMEGELGMKPASDAEKRLAAKKWFEINLRRFGKAVCSNKIVKNHLLGKENKTRNELLAAVIDVLLKLGGWGSIPIAVLSARLIHYGLDRLCPSSKKRSKK